MTKYLKRIGIDARLMLRPLRGMPLYVTRVCQLLPALNRDYEYYYFINRGFEHNDNVNNYQPLLDELAEKNHNVRIINYDDDAEIMWEQLVLPKLLKEYNIDILHMPANRTCFFTNIPVIVTVHDVMEYIYIRDKYISTLMIGITNIRNKLYSIRKTIYAYLNYKIGFNKAEKIITVSNYSADDIVKQLGISPSKVTAIHHGLDKEFILDQRDQSHSETTRQNYVLMLGGDSYHKNPEGAIAAWAKVSKEIRNKYSLIIVGFCGDEQSPLMRALMRDKLHSEVEVKGWVSQFEMIEYMRNAALFLYLSRYEGFGFPILHAMSSGTPIISSNKASIPEVLDDVGLKFDPDDHIGIARGIEQLLSDNTLWTNQSCEGILRSLQFSWNDSAKKHLKVYEEVMGVNSGYIL